MVNDEIVLWKELLGKLDFSSGIVNLFVTPKISKKYAEKLDRLEDGSNKAKLLQEHYKKYCKSNAEKLEYLASLTTHVHERKHWHDMVGSVLGFSTHYLFLIQKSRQIMAVRNIAQTKRPLYTPLKFYFNTIISPQHNKEYIEHEKILSRFVKGSISPTQNVFQDVSTLKESDFEEWLEDVVYVDRDTTFTAKTPIIGLSLFEASAVLAEVFAVNDLISEEAASLYLQKRYKGANNWAYNSLISHMIKANDGIHVPLMLAIISNSVNYPINGQGEESNPCKRFKVFVDALAATEVKPFSLEEIASWLNSVVKSKRWKSNIEIATELIAMCDETICMYSQNYDPADPFSADCFEGYLIDFMQATKSFFTKYRDDITYWANPYFYDQLPHPPITLTDTTAQLYNFERDSVMAFRWFSAIDILDQLFTKKAADLICPMKVAGNCKLQTDCCGKLPFQHPEEKPLLHPECIYYITACDLLAPDWILK